MKNQQPQQVTKAAVSVTEMAAMVGLSRARFYQLLGAVFPWPCYDLRTRRPLFTEEQQKMCLEARRTHRGIDGQAVVFFSPRKNRPPEKPAEGPQGRQPSPSGLTRGPDRHAALVASLKALGLEVNREQVAVAVGDLFPDGVAGTNHGEVIRLVFRHLRRPVIA